MRPVHKSTGSVPRRQLAPTGRQPSRSAATRASGRIASAPVSARDCCIGLQWRGGPPCDGGRWAAAMLARGAAAGVALVRSSRRPGDADSRYTPLARATPRASHRASGTESDRAHDAAGIQAVDRRRRRTATGRRGLVTSRDGLVTWSVNRVVREVRRRSRIASSSASKASSPLATPGADATAA
jgi:hypothetical protein